MRDMENQKPIDAFEFWVRFVCAFLVFGGIFALFSIRIIERFRMSESVAVEEWAIYFWVGWLLITLTISIYAGLVGDRVWACLSDSFGGFYR